MEKIDELLGELEASLAKETKIELLEKCETNLRLLNSLMTQTSEKKKEVDDALEGKATESGLAEYFTNVSTEINTINEKFTELIELTKKLEADKAIKQFLIQKLNEIFTNISNEASRQFNLSTLETFDEFAANLKTEMEKNLIDRIEKELFSLQTELGKFQKIYDMVEPQFSSIRQSINNMTQQYQDQLASIHLESEIIQDLFPKINDATQTLNNNYDALQSEVGNTLLTIQQTPLQLLSDLRAAIDSYKEKARDEMVKENIRMKAELDNVNKELEKVSVDFQHLSKAKDQKIEMREVLALCMTLLVEVFGAQPHSKLLYLLHGQKADMDRETLTKASGISGAMVRKALADLDAAKLVKYDVVTSKVKLLKRIY